MAAHPAELRPAPLLRTVSESTRQRETFKYDSTLVATTRLNDAGVAVPSSELVPSKDLVLTGLAQLAIYQTGTRRATISLFDMERQYFISEAVQGPHRCPGSVELVDDAKLWMCGTAIPRAHSLCEYTLLAKDSTQFDYCDADANQLPVLVVPDLRSDVRFASKPYCSPGNPARFYAAVPIRTQRGINIGVLSVVSPEPNAIWSSELSTQLRNLSVTIMDHLEANRSKTAHRRSERMVRGLGFFVEGKSMSASWHSIPGRPTFSESQDALELTRRTLREESVDLDTATATPQSKRSPSPTIERPNSASHKKDRPAMKWAESFQPGPNPMVDTFSEAANIIRESLETDGCLFLDATLGSFGAFDTRPHESRKTNQSSRPSSSSPTSSGGSSDEDVGSTSGEPLWPPCQVLAYSMSEARNLEACDGSLQNVSMAQKYLAKLLQRYPKGHIFNFDANGELQSSDSSDDDGGLVPELDTPQPPSRQQTQPEIGRARRQKQPWARQNEVKSILQVFPGARSVAFVPVWDPRKQRWCAGGFVYTLNPTRIFTVEGELNYLRAFGILAIAETLRLKTIAANQAKTDALGSLSHELRSPLHGAILGIELLRDTEMTVFQGNVAHTIETCCRTLVDTVDHLLDYSKVNKFIHDQRREKQESEPRGLRPGRGRSVEAGMLSLYRHISLDGLVEEVVDGVYAGFSFQHMSITQLGKNRPTLDSNLSALRRLDRMKALEEFGPSISNKGEWLALGEVVVCLEMDWTCSWRFYTQPGAIRRIVMNLFGNALKYTQRGIIRVCLTQSKPKSGSSSESMVEITVADTGQGMSEDYLRNELYKPFSQEDHLAPGTGLGLSFVKQITSHLRGKVSVDSQVGVGTTVRVELPLVRTLSHPIPSENEQDFEKHVQEMTGLRIQLKGFERLKGPGRQTLDGVSMDVKALFEQVCREWLHLSIISGEEAKIKEPDMIIWLDEEVLAGLPPQEIAHGPPGVVVCRNAFLAYEAAIDFENVNTPRVFEFVSQPVAPRKLAKALCVAYKRWKDTALSSFSATSYSDGLRSNHLDLAKASTEPPPPLINRKVSIKRRTDTSVAPLPLPEGVPEFLLVEDNSINLNILSIYMKKLGRAYHTATNGFKAVEAYKANPNHCKYIFMDISMPVMDGFEATRRIRAYERENQIKPSTIFALTGLASESAQQEALGSGVDLFLTKPVKLKELDLILKSRGLLNGDASTR